MRQRNTTYQPHSRQHQQKRSFCRQMHTHQHTYIRVQTAYCTVNISSNS